MKKLRRSMGFFFAVIMLFNLTVSASAAEVNDEVEFGEPIRVIEYVDEYGNQVVEKIYFKPDPGSFGISFSDEGDISVCDDARGSGWYEKEKQVANAPKTYMYVRAYFVWGDGDVTVSNARGWVENLASGVTMSGESVTTGTGRFALVFNKYAYAEYYFITRNTYGSVQANTVRVTVSESGNVS